jgi:hypothetical protein
MTCLWVKYACCFILNYEHPRETKFTTLPDISLTNMINWSSSSVHFLSYRYHWSLLSQVVWHELLFLLLIFHIIFFQLYFRRRYESHTLNQGKHTWTNHKDDNMRVIQTLYSNCLLDWTIDRLITRKIHSSFAVNRKVVIVVDHEWLLHIPRWTAMERV